MKTNLFYKVSSQYLWVHPTTAQKLALWPTKGVFICTSAIYPSCWSIQGLLVPLPFPFFFGLNKLGVVYVVVLSSSTNLFLLSIKTEMSAMSRVNKNIHDAVDHKYLFHSFISLKWYSGCVPLYIGGAKLLYSNSQFLLAIWFIASRVVWLCDSNLLTKPSVNVLF